MVARSSRESLTLPGVGSLLSISPVSGFFSLQSYRCLINAPVDGSLFGWPAFTSLHKQREPSTTDVAWMGNSPVGSPHLSLILEVMYLKLPKGITRMPPRLPA